MAQLISNKEDYIQYLQNQIKNYNKDKKNMIIKNKKYPDKLDIDFIIYNREERPDIINQLYFTDFSSYQCITRQYIEKKYIINSYNISTLKDGISHQLKIIKKKIQEKLEELLIKNL